MTLDKFVEGIIKNGKWRTENGKILQILKKDICNINNRGYFETNAQFNV